MGTEIPKLESMSNWTRHDGSKPDVKYCGSADGINVYEIIDTHDADPNKRYICMHFDHDGARETQERVDASPEQIQQMLKTGESNDLSRLPGVMGFVGMIANSIKPPLDQTPVIYPEKNPDSIR